MSTTARSDLVAGLRTILLARQAASPTLLRKVYNARPGSFPETPCAYIGPRDEVIAITAQTKTRTFAGLTVVIVDTFADASEEADRMDDLVDLLVGDFMTYRNNVGGGGGKIQLSSISDTDISVSTASGVTATYRGAVLTFGPSFIQEGLEATA